MSTILIMESGSSFTVDTITYFIYKNKAMSQKLLAPTLQK